LIAALVISQILLEPHSEVSTGMFTKNEQRRGGWAFFKVGAEVFRFKGVGLIAGGWAGVMTKEGQGIIQFAPWWADYCGYASRGESLACGLSTPVSTGLIPLWTARFTGTP